MDTNTALIILNGILVVVTAIYVFLTLRILRSNVQAVKVMRQQTEALYRPYITITHAVAPDSFVTLSIKNSGKTNAHNLTCKIDRNFYPGGRKNEEFNLAQLHVFTNTINTFAPESEIRLMLGPVVVFHDCLEDHPLTPTVFNITATYSFSGQTVTETTTIDLRLYRHIFLDRDIVGEELAKLRQSAETIAKIMANKPVQPNQLKVPAPNKRQTGARTLHRQR
jgi:hypothetical protein